MKIHLWTLKICLFFIQMGHWIHWINQWILLRLNSFLELSNKPKFTFTHRAIVFLFALYVMFHFFKTFFHSLTYVSLSGSYQPTEYIETTWLEKSEDVRQMKTTSIVNNQSICCWTSSMTPENVWLYGRSVFYETLVFKNSYGF